MSAPFLSASIIREMANRENDADRKAKLMICADQAQQAEAEVRRQLQERQQHTKPSKTEQNKK